MVEFQLMPRLRPSSKSGRTFGVFDFRDAEANMFQKAWQGLAWQGLAGSFDHVQPQAQLRVEVICSTALESCSLGLKGGVVWSGMRSQWWL